MSVNQWDKALIEASKNNFIYLLKDYAVISRMMIVIQALVLKYF